MRLSQVVAPYGSVTSLASAIDRSEGAVRKWLRGDAEPNATDLRLLSIATGVSVEWLLFGGEVQISASLVLQYLEFVIHQRDCEVSQKNTVPWSELSAARKRTLEQRVRAALNAWVLTNAARV